MEALQIIVKKLSNEIIDMKNNCGEGSSNPKKFFIFTPKKEKSTPPTTKNNPSFRRHKHGIFCTIPQILGK
jgi:hypothetical protein